MGGNRPRKHADQRSPENVGDEIWVGDIQHSKAVAIGRGATAIYHGLSIAEVAALVNVVARS